MMYVLHIPAHPVYLRALSEDADFLQVDGSHILAVGTDTDIAIYAVILSPANQLRLLSRWSANTTGYTFKLGSLNGQAVLHVDSGQGKLDIHRVGASPELPMPLIAEVFYPTERVVGAIGVSQSYVTFKPY